MSSRVRIQRTAVASLLLLASFLLVSCGSHHSPPVLIAVKLTPANATLALKNGRTLQLAATGHYSDGSIQNFTGTVTWAIVNAAANTGALALDSVVKGRVNPGSGIAGDKATITFTTSDNKFTDSTTVTLAPASFSIATTNDPFAVQQWHLKNTGQNPCAYSDNPCTAGVDINVDSVYANFTGYGVKVAIVDTGLEIAHEDLAGNVVSNGSWNFANNTTDPTSTLTDGDHGTSVAGVVGAQWYNGKGGIGVAPEAQLKGFNLLGALQTDSTFVASIGGSTSSPNSSDVAIFNQSFGATDTVPWTDTQAIINQYASGVTNLRGGKGALYIKAAGNGYFDINSSDATCGAAKGLISCENANFDYDNTLPYNIVVGGLNAKGVKSSYATTGSAIWVTATAGEYGANYAVHNQCKDLNGNPVTCPAEYYEPALISTDQSGCNVGWATTTGGLSYFEQGVGTSPNVPNYNTSCNYTNMMNGTSAATPAVSGVIALMLEANPNLTWRDVKYILAKTARQVDASFTPISVSLPNPTATSYTVEQGWVNNQASAGNGGPYHYHNWYGFGFVDAAAAVTLATTFTNNWGALIDTSWTVQNTHNKLNLTIPDSSANGATDTMTVTGAPSFIEAVMIQVDIYHSYWGDLAIELTSPSGTKSILKNIRDGFNYNSSSPTANHGMQLLSNAFYGEPASGNWTIRVIDGNSSAPSTNTTGGTLNAWLIRFLGH